MFCSNCGQNLAGVATLYCPNCGHAEEILKTMNMNRPQQGGYAPHGQPGGQPTPPNPQYQQAPPPHGYPPQGHYPQGHPPQGYAPYGYPPYGFYAKPPAQGMAGAALGLGIAAFVLPIPVLDLILGLVALVLAVMVRSRGNRTNLSTAGLILAIVGTAAAFFHTVFMVFIFSTPFIFGW